MIMSNTFYPVWQLFAQNRKYQVCVTVSNYWKFSSHRLLTTEGDMFAMGGKKKRGISDYLNFPPIRMEINFWPQAVLCLWWVARGEGERGTSRQMYIREETCSIFKHCQRHNGPEGWVLLTKVSCSSDITRWKTNFDLIWSEEIENAQYWLQNEGKFVIWLGWGDWLVSYQNMRAFVSEVILSA